MSRTTPPRPLDVEAFFPELAEHRGTATRLHPRPGGPTAADSSVGGPLRWPADEPWPVCGEFHGVGEGRRPADVRRLRRLLSALGDRPRTERELVLIAELGRLHRMPDPLAPVPLIALAQLYRRDVPDLPPGPDGCDLLQVFWCPFETHGPGRYERELVLRWRRSAEVGRVLAAAPEPPVVGSEHLLPEPCVLHPQRVVVHQFAGLLPEGLCARLDAWDEANEAAARAAGTRPVDYQEDLSIPPGWRVGGFASWHATDPYPVDCPVCGTAMRLLLVIDSSEAGGGSWAPVEDRGGPVEWSSCPTWVQIGDLCELNVFDCPADPAHPPRWCIQ
ncbi:hypothetical protein [Kitasatospora sp. NPDC057198]|uniref:hypothetical protein n=1 Tax=Kitasatospora sp. NPDC057198 TaxID=3346046 RepID=UPI00363F04B3